jgi:hypothetical protein
MKWFVYAVVLWLIALCLVLVAGCATQRTLCEDLSPFDCRKMQQQMNPEPMRPVFDRLR